MQNINRTINRLFTTESLSVNEPIRNPKAKGRDTVGMVAVKLRDAHNTVIYCETEAEAERIKPVYEEKLGRLGTGRLSQTELDRYRERSNNSKSRKP